MSGQPLVSVIIPTYNRATQVCAAVESVRAQTYRRRELIVVDDGSTDDTFERLRTYAGEVTVVRQDNAGAPAARNTDIRAARGDVIAFLDSDDLWMPTNLERQVRCLEDAGPRVICSLCNAVLEFADGSTDTSFRRSQLFPLYEEGVWINAAEVLSTRFVMFNQMVAIRAPALHRIGLFDEAFRHGLDDTDLSLRLALEGPWAYIREPLAVWRQGTGNGVSRQAASDLVRFKRDELKVRERALAQVEGRHGRQAIKKALSRAVARTRYELWMAGLRQSRRPVVDVAAALLLQVQRCREALERRLPGYPRMKVEPIRGDVTTPSGVM